MIKKTDIIQTVLWLAHAMSSKIHTCFVPPANKSFGVVYGNHPVCLSIFLESTTPPSQINQLTLHSCSI